MNLGLRTVIYKVSDLTAAKAWYSDVFQTDPYFDEPFYVGFNIGGYELGLLPTDLTPGEKTEAVVAYWGVENIHKEFERIVSLGATAHEGPENVGGELMTATLKDPWGNVIGLIYNPYFRLPEDE